METLSEDTQRRVVKRVATMRVLGLGLGLLPILVVLHELKAPMVMWLLAAANALVWPWVARRIAMASSHPMQVERRNLIIDSIMGGMWVSLMQFNAAPSLVLVSMLLMDKFAFGGVKLAARATAGLLASAVVFAALNGFSFAPSSSTLATLATLPLLLAYPSAIALAAHTLSERVRKQSRKLAELSRTDALTGLANRRALMESLDHEFRRFRRGGYRATLMMLDVDRFKLLNDTHGHAVGDEALRAIAKVLKKTLRDTDTAGRYGGDEFAVVLTDASGARVGDLAERLRQAIAAAELVEGQGVHATVSIGYAELDSGMHTGAQWIAAADAALYRAKSGGRNRAMSAPSHGPAP